MKREASPHDRRDPSLLQLLGAVTEVLGLAEQIERLLHTKPSRIEATHRSIRKSLSKFQRAMTAGRGAIRQINSTLAAQVTDAPKDTVALLMPYSDLQIFRSGLEQLQRSIRDMFFASHELEALSEQIPEEATRLFLVNEAGRPVLELLREVIAGSPEKIPELLEVPDQHFARCERLIEERAEWLSQ